MQDTGYTMPKVYKDQRQLDQYLHTYHYAFYGPTEIQEINSLVGRPDVMQSCC